MGVNLEAQAHPDDFNRGWNSNWWHWRALANYVCHVSPEITSKCRYWHSNDADGLNDEDSKALSMALRKELISGRTAEYIADYETRGESADYPLDTETIGQFAEFLYECGGFKIY